MKSKRKQTYLFIFSVLLLVDMLAIGLDKEEFRFFSKPLLMPFLAAHFLHNVHGNLFLRNCILAALFFSWAGDVLLMFQSDSHPVYFLLGLSSFLVAHICYIVFYHRIRIAENVKGRWWMVIIVAVYYATLIAILYPYLADMRIPVLVYGMTISIMLLLALHMTYISNKQAGSRIMIGAILFILSDSLLAINMFYQPFRGAGIVIMLSYGLAQYFIVAGAQRYIFSQAPETSPALVS